MLWENPRVKDTLMCGLVCLLSSLNGTWARCQKTRRSNANTSYPHRCDTAGHDPMPFHPVCAKKQFFRPRFRSELLLMKASFFKVMFLRHIFNFLVYHFSLCAILRQIHSDHNTFSPFFFPNIMWYQCFLQRYTLRAHYEDRGQITFNWLMR